VIVLVAVHFQIPLFLFNHFKFSFMSLGWNEILLILLVVLLLFGGRKIPELMRGMGKGIREFNDAKNNVRKEIEEGINEPSRPTTTSTPTNSTTTPQP
jgi:sec-independent protein translocase protein TatA